MNDSTPAPYPGDITEAEAAAIRAARMPRTVDAAPAPSRLEALAAERVPVGVHEVAGNYQPAEEWEMPDDAVAFIRPASAPRLTSDPLPANREKVMAFELDGKPYLIDKKPQIVLALRVLEATRKGGQAEGTVTMLTGALGEEGWAALLTSDAMEKEDFDAILDLITKHVMGGLQGKTR